MQVSYSRVSTFKQCPYQFKLRYIDKLEPLFNLDPANALVLGTAMHEGIEKDVITAISGYYSNYPSVTPAMVNEAIKLEVMIGKAREALPRGVYEMKLETDDFKGFIDLLVKVDENRKILVPSGRINPNTGEVMGYEKEVHQMNEIYDLYDFKYSNNVKNYMESGQLHIYKYFFEMLNPGKMIRNLFFVFIPKVKLKQEENESLEQYRARLQAVCREESINIASVEFDYRKVVDFLLDTKHLLECQEFEKKPNNLCYFCDYKNYCQSDGKNMVGLVKKEEIE